jgi:gas vesicle protein
LLAADGMRLWVLIGVLIGVVLATVAAYFLPERETVITRDVVFEDVRDKAAVFGPMVNDLLKAK